LSETKDSSRWIWAATIVLVATLAAAVCVAAFWPGIQLRYHCHYFQNGTERQQLDALGWICDNRLKANMSKAEAENLIGEPLEKRFSRESRRDFSLFCLIKPSRHVRASDGKTFGYGFLFRNGRLEGWERYSP
jgi:hypothetical protein